MLDSERRKWAALTSPTVKKEMLQRDIEAQTSTAPQKFEPDFPKQPEEEKVASDPNQPPAQLTSLSQIEQDVLDQPQQPVPHEPRSRRERSESRVREPEQIPFQHPPAESDCAVWMETRNNWMDRKNMPEEVAKNLRDMMHKQQVAESSVPTFAPSMMHDTTKWKQLNRNNDMHNYLARDVDKRLRQRLAGAVDFTNADAMMTALCRPRYFVRLTAGDFACDNIKVRDQRGNPT